MHVVVSGRAYDYLKTPLCGHDSRSPRSGATAWSTRTTRFRTSRPCSGTSRAPSRAGPRTCARTSISPSASSPTWSSPTSRAGATCSARATASRSCRSTTCRSSTAASTPPEILEGKTADFALTKAIVKAKVAGALHYYITTFFYPPLRKPEQHVAAPARAAPGDPGRRAGGGRRARGGRRAAGNDGEHLLVYQTSTSNEGLPGILQRCGLECRIYGLRRDLTEDLRDGNLLYRPFSEAGFIDDLRTARGVVAGGGFTLMGEAVYLRRPMLAIPVRKQFEQVLNARYLRGRRLRPRPRGADGRAPWGRSSSGLPDFARGSPATSRTGTPICWRRSRGGSRRRGRGRRERGEAAGGGGGRRLLLRYAAGKARRGPRGAGQGAGIRRNRRGAGWRVLAG